MEAVCDNAMASLDEPLVSTIETNRERKRVQEFTINELLAAQDLTQTQAAKEELSHG